MANHKNKIPKPFISLVGDMTSGEFLVCQKANAEYLSSLRSGSCAGLLQQELNKLQLTTEEFNSISEADFFALCLASNEMNAILSIVCDMEPVLCPECGEYVDPSSMSLREFVELNTDYVFTTIPNNDAMAPGRAYAH